MFLLVFLGCVHHFAAEAPPAVEPARFGIWLEAPAVVWTKEFPDAYEDELCAAVGFVKATGHKISDCHEYSASFSPYLPNNRPHMGDILFDLAPGDVPESVLGATLPEYDTRTGEMYRANIIIQGTLKDEQVFWVIVHELFHAMGYDHVSNPAHIMNPYYAGGMDTRGLGA